MSVTVSKPQSVTTSGGGFSLIPRNMDDALRIADMMFRSKSIPEHLKSPGDCLMVVEQAGRWEMSPFAVAQCTFSYKGRLGYEGKLIQAVLEGSPMSRRIIASLMDYKFGGEGEDRYVVASALRVGEDERREVKVTLREARTQNEHWKIRPDQMLCYHAARVWARRWAPSIMLGVYTIDEIYNPEPTEAAGLIIEGEAVAAAETRDEMNANLPLKPTTQTVADSDAMTPREMADAILAKIGRAPDEDGLHLVAGAKSTNRMRDMLKEHAPELDQEIADAFNLQFQRLRGEEVAA